MSTCSRGLGLRLSLLGSRASLTAPHHQQLLQPFSQRLFTSLSPLRYTAAKPTPKGPRTPSSLSFLRPAAAAVAAKAAPPPSRPPAKTPPTATEKYETSTYALIQQLAQKGQPTLIYEAGSHFWMKLAAWVGAGMFYGYAIVNYYTAILNPIPDLSSWIPYAFAIICLASAGFASYFIFAIQNIVHRIRAVPTTALTPAQLPAGANPKTTPIHLEITLKRNMPGRPKVMIVPPEKASLPNGLFRLIADAASPPLTPAQERALSRQEKAEAKKQWEYDQKHLMTVPIRHAGQGVKTLWYHIQKLMSKGGFAKMEVDGKNLKLDVESGWADVRALKGLTEDKE